MHRIVNIAAFAEQSGRFSVVSLSDRFARHAPAERARCLFLPPNMLIHGGGGEWDSARTPPRRLAAAAAAAAAVAAAAVVADA